MKNKKIVEIEHVLLPLNTLNIDKRIIDNKYNQLFF